MYKTFIWGLSPHQPLVKHFPENGEFSICASMLVQIA